MFCDHCGAELAGTAKFCSNCGQPVAQASSSATAATPVPAASVAPSEQIEGEHAEPRPQQRSRWRTLLVIVTLGLWALVPLTRRLWRGGHRMASIATGVLSSFIALILLLVIVAIAQGGKKNNQPSSAPSSAPVSSAPASSSATTLSHAASKPKTSRPNASKDEQNAAKWITAHGFDADKVQANIEDVQIRLGMAIKTPTQANVDLLAQQAQEAHDNLDAIRDDFTTTDFSGELGNAQLNAFSGANDLKNAMGALVAYTGDPTPATLAHFTSQYQNAASEWDSGVRTIWRLAHRKHPPTVSG